MWVLFLWTSWMCTMDDAMMKFTPIFVICSHIQIMMMIVNAVRVKPRPESHLVKLGKHDSLLQMMLQWGKLRHMLSDPGWMRFTFENPGWDGGGWTCWRLKYRLRQERNDQWTWCCDSRSTVYGLRSTANTRVVSAQGVEIMGEMCYNLQRITINKRWSHVLSGDRISERFGLRKVAPPTNSDAKGGGTVRAD